MGPLKGNMVTDPKNRVWCPDPREEDIAAIKEMQAKQAAAKAAKQVRFYFNKYNYRYPIILVDVFNYVSSS